MALSSDNTVLTVTSPLIAAAVRAAAAACAVLNSASHFLAHVRHIPVSGIEQLLQMLLEHIWQLVLSV